MENATRIPAGTRRRDVWSAKATLLQMRVALQFHAVCMYIRATCAVIFLRYIFSSRNSPEDRLKNSGTIALSSVLRTNSCGHQVRVTSLARCTREYFYSAYTSRGKFHLCCETSSSEIIIEFYEEPKIVKKRINRELQIPTPLTALFKSFLRTQKLYCAPPLLPVRIFKVLHPRRLVNEKLARGAILMFSSVVKCCRRVRRLMQPLW